MIRGVSKNVIEIVDTGNDCFERAILFIRPDSHALDRDHLSRQAREYLSRVKLRPRLFLGMRFVHPVVKLACVFVLGALTAALLMNL